MYLSQLDQFECHYKLWRKIIHDMRTAEMKPRGKSNRGSWNAPNCTSVQRITPHVGLLVVFPSWLEHRVEPHENREPRISIAMNLS